MARALNHTPERLTTPIYPSTDTVAIVSMFPHEFRDALVRVNDTSALGDSWSRAIRACRTETAAAVSSGCQVESLRPYFAGVAHDIVELARQAAAMRKNLYLHFWPD